MVLKHMFKMQFSSTSHSTVRLTDVHILEIGQGEQEGRFYILVLHLFYDSVFISDYIVSKVN
jgi:hypothetical protein